MSKIDILLHLQKAQQELDAARELLNHSSENCGHCGRTTFANWDEAKAFNELGSAREKVAKWRREFSK